MLSKLFYLEIQRYPYCIKESRHSRHIKCGPGSFENKEQPNSVKPKRSRKSVRAEEKDTCPGSGPGPVEMDLLFFIT